MLRPRASPRASAPPATRRGIEALRPAAAPAIPPTAMTQLRASRPWPASATSRERRAKDIGDSWRLTGVTTSPGTIEEREREVEFEIALTFPDR